MKGLKTLVILAVVLAALGGLATLMLPSHWEVSRSITIAAPSDAVHAWVADLRAWESWSPFEKQDPEMTFSYSAVTSGVDARRSWTSAAQGNGWMTITAADPARGVWYDIGFDGEQPFKGVLLYAAVPGGTAVTWTSAGDVGERLPFRWTLLLMDRVFGPVFEQGLADLEAVVEGHASAAADGPGG